MSLAEDVVFVGALMPEAAIPVTLLTVMCTVYT
jgi:hypothetical protein